MIYHGNALDYIYETPDILQHIMENQDGILAESSRALKDKKISEIYLTGSGSSYNAAVGASALAKKLLGIRVTPVYPVLLMEDRKIISRDAVVVGISQQGTSMAVIRALDAVRACGITAISMTGEFDTEITRHGDGNIYIECGYEDAGATTKGYTATVLILMLWAIKTAEILQKISRTEADEYRERIRKVILNMNTVLKNSRGWCECTAEKLKDSTDVIIISSSNQTSILLEGVLKFSETCRYPVRGYEAEEFMHGMYNAVSSETVFLYLFPSDGYEKERMERLFGYYEKRDCCQYGINGRFREKSGQDLLSCQFLDDTDFSCLEYILPLQMLFVLTSRARKIDLNIPKDPDFHKYMGSKLEAPDT